MNGRYFAMKGEGKSVFPKTLKDGLMRIFHRVTRLYWLCKRLTRPAAHENLQEVFQAYPWR